jgi:hypothetical protein
MTTTGTWTRVTAAAVTIAAAGCADSIRPEQADAGPPADARDGQIVPTGLVTTIDYGDGTFGTLVDATSAEDWTGLDLDTGQLAASDWDLGWRRASIRCNGGVSGAAGVEVAIVTDLPLVAIVFPPTTAYATDVPDGDDANTDPDYALRDWYDYDSETHVLTPKREVYVTRTSTGAHAAVEILEYYDPAGTSAWYLLHWKHLETP